MENTLCYLLSIKLDRISKTSQNKVLNSSKKQNWLYMEHL